MKQELTFSLIGGLDRSQIPAKADPASFYSLLNMRQSRTTRGTIEALPKLAVGAQIAQGTYWNGSASTTEATGTPLMYAAAFSPLGNIYITNLCVTRDSAQLKVLEQISYPSGTTQQKGCLLKAVNAGSMSVTLGNTYDVEIDGATTFKWRVNGGAYTTLVAIDATNGNLIDSNNVRLYWLTATGFTVADAWSWRRTDRASSGTGGLSAGLFLNTVYSNDRLYYSVDGAKVMVVEADTGGNGYYVRTVGYQYMSGGFLQTYENHLFNFLSTAWYASDRDNFDNFIATDTNEADFGSLPDASTSQGRSAGTRLGDSVVLGGRLFLLTTSGIFYTDYAGLPNPYNFRLLTPFSLSSTAIVRKNWALTATGAYVFDDQFLYFFSGGAPTLVSTTSFPLLFSGDLAPQSAGNLETAPSTIVYDPQNAEVHVAFPRRGYILSYQERYRTWYTRKVSMPASFSSYGYVGLVLNGESTLVGAPAGAFAGLSRDPLIICGASRTYWYEDTYYENAPAYDDAAGTAYVVPTLVTQLIGNNFASVKESDPLTICAAVTTTASANYSIGAFVKAVVSWFVSTNGQIEGSSTTDANAYWTSANTSGKVDIPRTSYRYIAFRLQITGTDSTKPSGSFRLNALEYGTYTSAGVKR